jgi:hypothetical protein
VSTVEPAGEGLAVTLRGEVHTVARSCGPAAGHWVCATHALAFPREADKDTHLRTGTHAMAWMCQQHGLETP